MPIDFSSQLKLNDHEQVADFSHNDAGTGGKHCKIPTGVDPQVFESLLANLD